MKRFKNSLLFAAFLFFLSTLPVQASGIGGLVLVPKKLPQGNVASATVTTLELETGRPVSVPIFVELCNSEGKAIKDLFHGSTGLGGMKEIEFKVPSGAEGSCSVRVTAGGESFEAKSTIVEGPAILIETDKPIYKPGQKIQGRVLLVNNELTPVQGNVELVITDGKGIRVARRQLETNNFGAASFSLPLAKELNLGTWKLKAASGESTNELAVQVDKYVLPQFSMEVEFDNDWFLPEEEITGQIESSYFFGKQVDGTGTIVAERYVGTWEEYARVQVDIVDGIASFAVPPVEYAAGTHAGQGDSTATLSFTVTDTGSHSEETTRLVKIACSPVEVRLMAADERIIPGMDFSFMVFTETPSGIPQDRTVEVTTTFQNEEGVIDTISEKLRTEEGKCKVTYKAPEEVLSANISAVLTEGDHVSRSYLNVFASHSPSAGFLRLSREGEGKVEIGEEVAVNATSTHTGTVFWEVLSSGRVLTNGGTRKGEFRFTATPEMIPRVEVVGYMLNPGNELACDTLTVPVKLDNPLDIYAAFSPSEPKPKPGDEIELTIEAPAKALIGVSVVDESLLALAEDRLTLRSVFEELERRFMEPKAEVHIEDEMWSPVTIPGAVETLSDAGLSVGSSSAISVPEGTQAEPWLKFRNGWFIDEGGMALPAAEGSQGGADLAEVKRVRQYFPETWVWEPLLLTDEDGIATLTLTCPDSITTWHMKAVASSAGGLGFTETDITVFQNFFVEPDLPVEVTRGEEFPLRIRVFNYAADGQEISIKLKEDSWFEILDSPTRSLQVGPEEVSSFEIGIKPVEAGSFPLYIEARGEFYADAVERKLRVVPEGIPCTQVTNGVLTPENEAAFELNYPPEAVADSQKTVVSITPSLVAQSLSGLDDLIGMPYGCGEQNMMFFSPDVEVLRYLEATGENYPEIWATCEHYINVGYQRQLTFRRSDGSFSAFGESDEEGSLYLTAFVLSAFSKARQVRDIDETVLSEASEWIKKLQSPDGSWEPFGFICHKELLGGLGGTYALTAYAAKALAEYDPDGNTGSLQSAKQYLASNLTTVSEEPYPLAVAAYALSRIPGAEEEVGTLLELLLPLAEDEGTGIHWEPYPVETTSYAALALLASKKTEANAAVEYISSRRGALGGFGSTQDTVMALQALIRAALEARGAVDASVVLKIDGEKSHTFEVGKSNYDILQTFEAPAGEAARLFMEGTGSVGYQIVKHFNVPGEEAPPPKNMLIQVEYQADHVAVDDIVDVNVTLNYPGPREQTNMVIADVGVPTGFQVVADSLSTLKEEGAVSRFEVAVRKVIFYIPELVREEPLNFTFQVRALFPVTAAPASSMAYDYYKPEDKAIDSGTRITVGSGTSTFIRGDANGDGLVDISDVVKILDYLFGQWQSPCVDSVDANDDGGTDVADAVYLLNYLFADGPQPPPPWKESGKDETPDSLSCRG